MKTFTLYLVASLLALTTAVPLEKRVLVTQTVTDVVVTTIDSTTTVWVKPTNTAHLAQHAHNHAHKKPGLAPAPAPAPKKVVAPVPAKPQSPPEVPSPLPVANKVAAPVAAPATPSPPEVSPVVQKAPQPAAPVYQAPSPPPAAPQPPAPVAASPAPAPEVNSGSTAECGKVGMPCSGEITFYDTGLGACGWTNDGTTENVFALAHGMMGAQSNGNPFCGRHAKVTLNGKTVTGKLVDKCGGCKGQDIDLSHSMFQALADEGKGRISDVKWQFID
ncbi:MAG: hypothetical protein Q9184_003008 [Pyrenodesmia sp. 2 TL-2023]